VAASAGDRLITGYRVIIVTPIATRHNQDVSGDHYKWRRLPPVNRAALSAPITCGVASGYRARPARLCRRHTTTLTRQLAAPEASTILAQFRNADLFNWVEILLSKKMFVIDLVLRWRCSLVWRSH